MKRSVHFTFMSNGETNNERWRATLEMRQNPSVRKRWGEFNAEHNSTSVMSGPPPLDKRHNR
jgi:hypothetical protein